MLRYTTDRARPGLVVLYDIRPGNGVGQFLQPQSPHGADPDISYRVSISVLWHCWLGDLACKKLTPAITKALLWKTYGGPWPTWSNCWKSRPAKQSQK